MVGHRGRLVVPMVVAFSVCIAAGVRTAAGVTIQAVVDGSLSGAERSVVEGPAASGSLLASESWPEASSIYGKDSARARAAQDDAGRSAVMVDGRPSGEPTPANHLAATSTWSTTVTNGGASPVTYGYQFQINAPYIALTYPGGNEATHFGRYAITVTANNVVVFESSARVSGTPANPQIVVTGTDLDGQFFDEPFFDYGYAFAAYETVIPLGTALPGGSLTVTTSLSVDIGDFAASEGAIAEIGDPLKLGGDPGMSGAIIEIEPIAVVPATWTAVKAIYSDHHR